MAHLSNSALLSRVARRWLVAAAACSSFAHRASAQQAGHVRVMMAGEPQVVLRIAGVLRESFAREGLSLDAFSEPRIDPSEAVRALSTRAASSIVAELWLDLSAHPPSLFLVGAPSELVYVRRLAVHPDPDSVETELIRFVVDQSVDAVLKGHREGVSRQEFEHSFLPVVPAPARPSSQPTPAGVEHVPWLLSAGYLGTALDSGDVLNGPEVSLAFRRHHFRLSLDWRQSLPLTVTRENAQLRLVATGFRANAWLPLPLGAGLVAALGLGVGADATRVAPRAVGAVRAFWAADPAFCALGELEKAWGVIVVSLHAGAEWAPVAARYVIVRSDAASTLWAPLRVRPVAGIRAGVSF